MHYTSTGCHGGRLYAHLSYTVSCDGHPTMNKRRHNNDNRRPLFTPRRGLRRVLAIGSGRSNMRFVMGVERNSAKVLERRRRNGAQHAGACAALSQLLRGFAFSFRFLQIFPQLRVSTRRLQLLHSTVVHYCNDYMHFANWSRGIVDLCTHSLM